jgi:hypothetical protein
MMTQVLRQIGNRPHVDAAAKQGYDEAAALLQQSVFAEQLPDFITLPAYQTYQ